MIDVLDQARCNRCGICLEVCPMDVFRRDDATGDLRVAHRDDCQTCFDCELECPRDAIRVGPLGRPRAQIW